MGHNIDLQKLLGLPNQLECPNCHKITRTCFDDYDIDCGEPESKNGIMHLDIQCGTCEHEFEFNVKIELDAEE